MDDTLVHIHLHHARLEVDVAVGYLAVAVHIGVGFPDENHRIFGGELHGIVEVDFFAAESRPDGIDCQGLSDE